MKLLALLALIFSITATAQNDSFHVLESSTATCVTKHDTFQYMAGAYKLSSPEASIANNTLKLTLDADFYTCGEFDGEIGFKKIGFLESFRKDIYNDLAGFESIEINTQEAVLNYVRDGVYNVIASSSLSNDTSKVTVEISIPSLLSEDEISALDIGHEVNASVDTFLMKKIKVVTSSQEYTTPVLYGTFRTQLTIIKENGHLKVIKN